MIKIENGKYRFLKVLIMCIVMICIVFVGLVVTSPAFIDGLAKLLGL